MNSLLGLGLGGLRQEEPPSGGSGDREAHHGSPANQDPAQALGQLTCVPWEQRERGWGQKSMAEKSDMNRGTGLEPGGAD